MKKSRKLLTVFLLAVTLGVFGNLNTVKAKSKIKISNSKITLTVRHLNGQVVKNQLQQFLKKEKSLLKRQDVLLSQRRLERKNINAK